MHVIELPEEAGAPVLVGPFASFLEAKEYMIDAYGNPHAGRVLLIQPIDPLHLIEPGL
jgi:hypothetical protein